MSDIDSDDEAAFDEIRDGLEFEEIRWHSLDGQDTVANMQLLTAS